MHGWLDRGVVGDMCSRPDRRPNITAGVLNGIRYFERWEGIPSGKVASTTWNVRCVESTANLIYYGPPQLEAELILGVKTTRA